MRDISLLILHFDDVYLYQYRLRSLGVEVDLRDLGGIRYLCSKRRLSLLEDKILPYNSFITFIGSGDFHYITYLFLRKIDTPFNLLLIDRHLDYRKTFDGFISCGSWLRDAVRLRYLKNVFYLGPDGIELEDKVIRFDRRFFRHSNRDLPFYISIDKDILDASYLETNWDQGDLTIEELLDTISSIPTDRIIGIDICGEPSFNPFNPEIKRSEEINLEILRVIKNGRYKRSLARKGFF